MNEELKPCPLCGGVVELRKTHDGRKVIECDNCNMSVFLHGRTREEIVDFWNKRAES